MSSPTSSTSHTSASQADQIKYLRTHLNSLHRSLRIRERWNLVYIRNQEKRLDKAEQCLARLREQHEINPTTALRDLIKQWEFVKSDSEDRILTKRIDFKRETEPSREEIRHVEEALKAEETK